MARLVAPPLWFAGHKFRQDWLASWLASPTAIRPAGYPVPQIQTDPDGRDHIAQSTVQGCGAKLSADEAEAVAGFLATLRPQTPAPKSDPIAADQSLRKGYTMFTKQYACIACHRIDYRGRALGGVSGPDLSQAGVRLQANWIAAFIDDHRPWIGPTGKPVYRLSDKKLEALTGFLAQQLPEAAQ